MSKKTIIITSISVVVLILVGVGVYFAYQKNNTSKSNQTSQSISNSSQRVGNRQNGNFKNIQGKILGIQDKQATVEDQDGNQNIVIFSDTTRITKTTTSTFANVVKAGASLLIEFQKNTGNMNAKKVTLQTPPPQNQNQSQNRSRPVNGDGAQNNNPNRNNNPNGDNQNILRGQVDYFTDTSIVLKIPNQNDGNQTVKLDSSVQYFEQGQGIVSDLKIDSSVQITATLNGTVITANSVTIQ